MNVSSAPKRSTSHQIFIQKCFDILGHSCAKCGSVENLTMDHVDWKAKAFNICRRQAACWWPLVLDELKKCQTLCQECHTKKSALERYERNIRPIVHGTSVGYSYRKCRCDLCCKAKYAANKEWYDRRGAIALAARLARKGEPVPPIDDSCGTFSGYQKRKCRCDACRKARRDRAARYAENKRIKETTQRSEKSLFD